MRYWKTINEIAIKTESKQKAWINGKTSIKRNSPLENNPYHPHGRKKLKGSNSVIHRHYPVSKVRSVFRTVSNVSDRS